MRRARRGEAMSVPTVWWSLLLTVASCTPAQGPVVRPAPEGAVATAKAEFVLSTRWSAVEGYERTRALRGCLESATDRTFTLVQRRTYAEVNALLAQGRGDVALVCSGVTSNPALRESMVPVGRLLFEGGPSYRSVVIVAQDDPADDLEDLRGSRIAWVDSDSLTGYRAVRAALRSRGEDPDQFFPTRSFTHSHDLSISSVHAGTVRAAAVDEEVLRQSPDLGARVVWTSDRFPSPPLLVRRGDAALAERLATLASDPGCFTEIGARGLAPADWEAYDGLGELVEAGR